MRTNTICLLVPGAILAAIVMTAGCTRQAPLAAEKAPHASTQAVLTDQMKDILAKADLVDGTADKIVARCAACDLAMDGSKEYSLKVGQYTLLFCSEDCKQTFAKDPEKSVLGIKLPKPQ